MHCVGQVVASCCIENDVLHLHGMVSISGYYIYKIEVVEGVGGFLSLWLSYAISKTMIHTIHNLSDQLVCKQGNHSVVNNQFVFAVWGKPLCG